MSYCIQLLRIASKFASLPSPDDLRSRYRAAVAKLTPPAGQALTAAISAVTTGRPLEKLSLEEFLQVHLTLVSAEYTFGA